MSKKFFIMWRFIPAFMFIFSCMPVLIMAQVNEIRGHVKLADGLPAVGATILVQGTNTGTLSDQKGEFFVKAQPGDTLKVSYVGYITEYAVASNTLIKVILEEDLIGLQDVIVIGYGTVRKSDLTGSVSTVEVESFKSIPSNSIDALLQGRSAGLQVINSSQDPGAESTVRIRGGSSLRGSNSPLVVVDGFPLGEAGNLKQINPADIASIEVLKDASAAAIYGSRGANGVILITTRRAEKGSTHITINQQVTLSKFNSELNLWRNAALMAQLNNEDRTNAGMIPLYTGNVFTNGVYYPSIEEIQDGTWPYYTRWDEQVFRELPASNNTTVGISSANEKTSFNLGFNYFDEQGIYIENDYRKGIITLAIDHKVFDKMLIKTSNHFSKGFRNTNNDLAYYRNPLWPVYNEEGSYFLAGKQDYTHPIALTERRINKTNTLDYISSWLIDYQLLNCLNVKSQLNYKYGTYISDKYFPKIFTETGAFNNGAAELVNWLNQSVISETYLTYDKSLSAIHRLTVMAGYSYEYYMSRSSKLASYDFVNEATGNENMGSGNPEKNKHENGLSKSKLSSLLGRVNYSLMDKYLLTFTMRADGSSKFGKNNRWAYFPSGAASWKMHHEDFIKDLNVFNELKIRVSYGISGNQGISPYQTMSRYGVEKYYYDDQWNTAIGPGYVVAYEGDDYRFRVWGGIPNDDLKWETTSQFDIGTDMAFMNRRLRVVFDYYVKNTTDLLREKLLSLSSGYNRMWVNDGEIQNKGFEITIDGDIIKSNDVDFSASFIFSRNRNEVVSLGNAITSGLNSDYITGMNYEFWGSSLTQFSQSPTILAIGQPVNVYYGYKVDGIIQTEAEGLAAGLTGAEAQPGEFKYVDLSGDGEFNDDDRTIIGDPNPDFTASLALKASYKKIDAEVFLYGVFGNDILYQNMWGGQANTMPLRWTPDNPNNDYPSLRQDRTYYLSDWYVKDGSFLRIQQVNLGYNFSFSKLKFISNARLYVNASNLYTFTKFKGYDPEVGTNGIYWGGYPRLIKYTFGLDITF
ncbi:MAG: TonB-dependent receptor [Bacteroidales bacterium]